MKKAKTTTLKKEEYFNQIVSENGQRIRRICGYYHANKDDQLDLYQEVLVNIWKSLDHFRGDAALSTWIYRIATNTSLQLIRNKKQRINLMVSDELCPVEHVYDEEGLSDKLAREHLIERLELEINQLSVIDKALITLMLEGLCVAEIADVIGITPSNVKTKIHRIKNFLRTRLKNENHA